MSKKTELKEIAHTGGKVKFNVKIDAECRIAYNVEWTHSRPTPAALFAVYAIPQGVAVGDIKLGGIGTPWNLPPLPGCFPVFISSDSTEMFATIAHPVMAIGERIMAERCARIVPLGPMSTNTSSPKPNNDALGNTAMYLATLLLLVRRANTSSTWIWWQKQPEKTARSRPSFMQRKASRNLFKCKACGSANDVLGTYAYCSSCGTRNDPQELEKTIQQIRDRINTGGPYETCVKEAVAAFDSFACQYAKQLLARVPLTTARKARLERAHFHNLGVVSEMFRNIFDIDFADCLHLRRRHNGI